MHRTITYMLILLLLASCTEKVEWEPDWQELDLLVVEGKITNEARAHEVKLSRPLYEVNGQAEPVSGARVEIYSRQNIYALLEDPLRPGTYITAPSVEGKVDSGYQLRIRYADFRIQGVSFMRPVSEFPDMNLFVVQQNPRLYGVHVSDRDGPSVIRMELDWSHVQGYETLPPEENHALIYHYSLSTVDVNRIFAPAREQVYFPPGTIVYREKESVSPAYEEFLRGMLSETDWRGGVFDVLPGNARSNLSGGAVGYFTAAAVLRDTVTIR